ncbi:MAG: hypothetical protein HUU16_12775 [Candidatus Omnitrophica bacterium]|nr:hypothetical protein [Candidatus Omnitrophota bacterium]
MVRWLFLDLNSYFASVEQELHPELRGKPIAVVPLMADTTFCIAASYEAKAFGVKTGTRVDEAKRMCPGLLCIQARHDHYVEYHHKIVDAVESCVPVHAVISIDEMVSKLTGSQQNTDKARSLALSIKATIREKVGSTLRCSIGLATNRFLAKVASDMQKPDGLTVIEQKDLPDILLTLQTRDFPGIGPRMEKRLQEHEIFTVKQLLDCSETTMRKIWGGVVGERFWHLLRAIGTGRWDLAALCVPFAFGTFLLVGKVGSATNYLFEMTMVACWVTGLTLAEIRHTTPTLHPLRPVLPILLTLGASFPTHLPHFYGEWKIFDWGGTPGRTSGDLTGTLVSRLRQIPEPIFSQDAGVALLSGHKLVWDPFIMTQLTQEGRFDPEPFHKMIRAKEFNALVLPFDTGLGPNAWKDTGWWSQFTEEVAAEIDKAYRAIPASPYDPRTQDPRLRGYFSPFGTNYLYLKR